jgi:penicillin-binding protein-related factor A (putative recombinase)
LAVTIPSSVFSQDIVAKTKELTFVLLNIHNLQKYYLVNIHNLQKYYLEHNNFQADGPMHKGTL